MKEGQQGDMIVEGVTYPDFCEDIEPVVAAWEEPVVPSQIELLPHSSYSPRYAWMYAFEKRLKYRIEEALGARLGELERCREVIDSGISGPL